MANEVKSKIYVVDTVENTSKKPTANNTYVHVYVEKDGEMVPALFTTSDVDKAIVRAEKNPEDVKPELTGFAYLIEYFFG